MNEEKSPRPVGLRLEVFTYRSCLLFPFDATMPLAKRHVAPVPPAGQARRRNTALDVLPNAKCLMPSAFLSPLMP